MGAPNSLYGRPPSGDVANYEVGVNSFYLNVGFPQADENAAGQRPPSPDYQISGVYMVTTVINRFENGQFIQYLTGHVDPATNMNTARDSLEGGSSPTGGVQNAIFGPDGSILPAQQQENATRGITNRPSAQPINQGGRPPPNIPDGSEGPF